MAQRASVLAGHVLPQSCSGGAISSLVSPSGLEYPVGTAPNLQGNMEPVHQEVEGALVLVRGALPADLDGRFIRNGPNPYLDRFGQPYHEFEGDGMLHSVDLKSGAAVYSNRWVRTDRVRLDMEKGTVSEPSEYVAKDRMPMGAANTALVHHAGRLLALYETDRPYVISAPSLETLGQLTYGGSLRHGMTAHPKVCPETGELVFFAYSLRQAKVHYGVADPTGERMVEFAVPTQGGRPVMMHDMAITRNYSILLEFPLYLDLARLAKGRMPFSHDAALPSKFGILPRNAKSASEVRWFQGKSAYAFHIANAWEEGQTIKLVGCPTPHFSFDYADSCPARLYEWTFDLDTGRTTERELDSTHVEFPVIHPRRTGLKNRFVFAARFLGGSPPLHSINGCVKYDLETGASVRHNFTEGRWGGECVFAPRTGGVAEDDGYLLTYTFNPKDNSTELYVVDARTMSPEPVAVLRTPQRVPFGFHGVWLPREQVV